jgi:hypothetical protein
VEASGVTSEKCYALGDYIHNLFEFEAAYKSLDDNERRAKRQSTSLHMLNLIFNKARMLAKDQVLME